MASHEDTPSNNVGLDGISARVDDLKKMIEKLKEEREAEAPRADQPFSPDPKFLSQSKTAFTNVIKILDQDKTTSAGLVTCIDLIITELKKAKEAAKQQGRYNLGIWQEIIACWDFRNAADGIGSDNFNNGNSRKGADSGTHDSSSSGDKRQIDSSGKSTHVADSTQSKTNSSKSKKVEKSEKIAHYEGDDLHTAGEGSQSDPSGRNSPMDQPARPNFDVLPGSQTPHVSDYDPYPPLVPDIVQETQKKTTVLPSPPDSPYKNQRLSSVEDETEQASHPDVSKQFAGPFFRQDVSPHVPAPLGGPIIRDTPLKRKMPQDQIGTGKKVVLEGPDSNRTRKYKAPAQPPAQGASNRTRKYKEAAQPPAQGAPAQGVSHTFDFTHDRLPTGDEYMENAEVQQRRGGRDRHAVKRLINEMH
jgi:hypothetical protein